MLILFKILNLWHSFFLEVYDGFFFFALVPIYSDLVMVQQLDVQDIGEIVLKSQFTDNAL